MVTVANSGNMGFTEGPAKSYDKVEKKPNVPYKKRKGFPPARKSDNWQVRDAERLMRPTSLPGTPPDYPGAALL